MVVSRDMHVFLCAKVVFSFIICPAVLAESPAVLVKNPEYTQSKTQTRPLKSDVKTGLEYDDYREFMYVRVFRLTCVALRTESCSRAPEKPCRRARTKAVCWPNSSSMAVFSRTNRLR